MVPTSSQLRRLGERLATTEFPDDADLDLPTEYEISFQPALDFVVSELAERFHVRATPRYKSVTSIVGKIRRERTRLTTMQDIAGCRVVVATIADQEDLVERLMAHRWAISQQDRRAIPSHGYRAVHLIINVDDRRVEVQVRTRLQDRWAQISEKLADRYGIEVKYGGGDEASRAALHRLSNEIQRIETVELRIEALDVGALSDDEMEDLAALRADIEGDRESLQETLAEILGMFTS